MSGAVIGLYLLLLLLVLILIGYPVAFVLLFVAVAAGFLDAGFLTFDLLIRSLERTMRQELLAAIPLFILMGTILERAGLMTRLMYAFQLLFSKLNGSLYLAVVSTSTVFSMATGIVGASVTVIGMLAGKDMQRQQYDVRMSAGAIAAGGTLGILIPPSIMLITLGPILNVPVLQLFAAVIGPGFLLATLFLAYCLFRCWLNPTLGPALQSTSEPVPIRRILYELMTGALPLGAVIVATLGSILSGLATPTEASALGALSALLLAAGYRRMSWNDLQHALWTTLKISSMVLLLIAFANYLGSVFASLGTPRLVSSWLLDLGLEPFALVIAILALVFIMGWALDWAPIVLVFIPVVLPVVNAAGIDPVWFGALVAICLQTAWLTPPVALSAYFLKSVMPEWSLKDIYLGMVQFLFLQLIGLGLVFFFPAIALTIPNALG